MVLTQSLARDAWYCATEPDDWGVATLNLRNIPDLILENLTIVNPCGFEHHAQSAMQLTYPIEATDQKMVSPTGPQMVQ